VCVYVYIYMYVYICIHFCIHTNIDMDMYVHICIHTYTHHDNTHLQPLTSHSAQLFTHTHKHTHYTDIDAHIYPHIYTRPATSQSAEAFILKSTHSLIVAWRDGVEQHEFVHICKLNPASCRISCSQYAILNLHTRVYTHTPKPTHTPTNTPTDIEFTLYSTYFHMNTRHILSIHSNSQYHNKSTTNSKFMQ